MPQRRDSAGAACNSGMGIFWMNLSVILKSKCGTAKLCLPLFFLFSRCSRYVAFIKVINLNVLLVYLCCTMPGDVADFRPIRGLEIILHTHTHTHTHTHRESTYCQALLYEQRLQKAFLHLKVSHIYRLSLAKEE